MTRPQLAIGAGVIFGIGLLFGTLLRAALVEDTSSCRGFDYGNVPQWVALGVGIVFGVFTVIGVRTSQSSYKITRDAFVQDVANTKVAQARLVYAEVTGNKKFSGAEARSFQTAKPNLTLGDDSIRVEQTANSVGRESVVIHADGRVLRILDVKIHNNSSEPISLARVELSWEGTTYLSSYPNESFGTIGPGKEVAGIFVFDNDTYAPDATLFFRDSSGTFWVRQGAEPVQSLNGWVTRYPDGTKNVSYSGSGEG